MKKLRETERLHEPVLLREVLEAFGLTELARSKNARFANRVRNLRFIDATLGLGGHAAEIVKCGAEILGIEADPDSLEIARRRLKEACPTPESGNSFRGAFTLVRGNFKDIGKIASENGFVGVDGVLFDLGISSYQLESKAIGLSFQNPSAPLDMRIDPQDNSVKASDLLAVLDHTQLIELFGVVLDKPKARAAAKAVVRGRSRHNIVTVGDFLYTIRGIFKPKGKLNPATLPFLALRIAVNSELENLELALPQSLDLLGSDGRLAVISFHSGEDSIVKKYFRDVNKLGLGFMVNRKPIVPKLVEIERNPRARSAKLRILQKI